MVTVAQFHLRLICTELSWIRLQHKFLSPDIRPFQKFTSVTAPGFEGDLTRIVTERHHAGLRQFLSVMTDQDRALTSVSPAFFLIA